ncbi:hypothetical protein FQR65_LT02102 [Abscondita terminalis]|nr:hypothetical protein FQR65_LT02102 [Abscondita terminalis]
MAFKLVVVCVALLCGVNAGFLGAPATYAPGPAIGVAYSSAPAVSHFAYSSPIVSYGTPYAANAPAITSQSSNILRSYGNLGQISTYSKSIDTPFSSVQKSDVRVSNPGLKIAAAPALAYAAAPAAIHAAPAVAYAAPAAIHAAPAVAYSAAPAVSHVTYSLLWFLMVVLTLQQLHPPLPPNPQTSFAATETWDKFQLTQNLSTPRSRAYRNPTSAYRTLDLKLPQPQL